MRNILDGKAPVPTMPPGMGPAIQSVMAKGSKG
jgi:hypothetical protein